MFISNETLVEKYFAAQLHEKDFLRHFLIIKEMIKKYGARCLEEKVYLESIKKHSPESYEIIHLLKELNKLELRHITQIISLLKKKYALVKKEFAIKSSGDMPQDIEKFLTHSLGNSEVSFHTQSQIGIDVKGEGYRYKRDLDRDLNLLLG